MRERPNEAEGRRGGPETAREGADGREAGQGQGADSRDREGPLEATKEKSPGLEPRAFVGNCNPDARNIGEMTREMSSVNVAGAVRPVNLDLVPNTTQDSGVTESSHRSDGFATFPLRDMKRDGAGKASCTCSEGAACKSVGKHPACYWSALGKGERRHTEGKPYGIATGSRSGVFVVDTDIKPGINGDMALTSLGNLPTTRTVRSGSGGHHYYLNLPEGFNVRCSAGIVGPGIDIRGEGGFVVGPGSPHKSGGTYELVVDAPVADAPEWLLSILRAQSAARGKGGTGEIVSAIARGPEHADFDARCNTAVAYLAGEAPVSISGKDGSKAFFNVCVKLVRTLELPLDVCKAMINEVYQPRLPEGDRWSEREIEHKLTEARDKSDRPTGSEAANFLDALRAPSSNPANDEAHAPGYNVRPYDMTAIASIDKKLKAARLSELTHILRTSPFWEGVIRLNRFSCKIEFHAPRIVGLGGSHSEYVDSDAPKIAHWLETQQGLSLASESTLLNALLLVAESNSYDPIVDGLHALAGKRRRGIFDGLALRLFGDETPIADTFLRKHMIAGVRRALGVDEKGNPRPDGVKVDTIVILQGEQGHLKSQAIEAIMGLFGAEYHTHAIKGKITHTDQLTKLCGAWGVEFAELNGFSKHAQAELKDYLSTRKDTYRSPYGRVNETHTRRCILWGTTNEDGFLKDPTGDRRSWPIKVTKELDLALVMKLREELWAEAYALHIEGELHWLTKAEEIQANAARAPHLEGDDLSDLVARFLRGRKGVNVEDVARAIMTDGGGSYSAERLDKKMGDRIRNILKAIGCVNKSSRVGDQVKSWRVPDHLAKAEPSSILDHLAN
jgi:predicted P-loop ATPase